MMEKLKNSFEKLLNIPVEVYLIIVAPIVVATSIAVFFEETFVSLLEKNFYRFDEISYKNAIRKSYLDIKIIYPEKNLKIEEIIDIFTLKPVKVLPKTKKNNRKKKPPPRYYIQAIYIGVKKYVIINNHIFTEGDKISDKEWIVRIERDRVLLDGYWGRRWVYLLD